MIAPNPEPAPVRAKRPPSPRNSEIFEAVRVLGQRQVDVAARYGLSQRRISAICAQVDEYQRWAHTAPSAEELAAQHRRLALLQSRQRAERMLIAALRHAVQGRQELVTEVRRQMGGEETVQRTVREVPMDAQWLKVAAQISRDVARMNERLGPDATSSLAIAELDELLARAAGEAGPTTASAHDETDGGSPSPNGGADYSSSSKTYED
jgi:hypothetical protein